MNWSKFLALATSKTVWGAIISQIPNVLANPRSVTTWVSAAGIVLGVAGARDAISQAAEQVASSGVLVSNPKMPK